MKRLWPYLLVLALACLPMLLFPWSHAGMLGDSDTAVLLNKIREVGNPWAWFGSDWPLGNHFYRPISTLTFEMDNGLHGTDYRGYALTNLLLCIGSVLALFWCGLELFRNRLTATVAACVFALFHSPHLLPSMDVWWCLAAVVLVISLARKNLQYGVIGALLILFLGIELLPRGDLAPRVLGWLPGRTATSMTLFGLLALASFLRHVKIFGKKLRLPKPTALDLPATKSSEVSSGSSKFDHIWLPTSMICLALALGSYEQAIMLPVVMILAAFGLQKHLVRASGWMLVSGIMVLVIYLALRSSLVPSEVSEYQRQQFRAGPGTLSSLLDYILPAGYGAYQSLITLIEIPAAAITIGPWKSLLLLLSNVVAFLEARKDWVLPLVTYAMSVVAYLPMAFLKQFGHYHYLPVALRSLFIAIMVPIVGRAIISAMSRPEVQSPSRQRPAPGSLPRR